MLNVIILEIDMYKLLSFIFLLLNAKHLDAYETVDVELQYYKGVWYQTYGDNFEEQTFENDAYCVYANYTPITNNEFHILNAERKGSITGTYEYIEGYGKTTDTGGELLIYLSDQYPAPYWIIKIGPIFNDEYQYSVVSDPYKIGLYVLARDVDEYYQLYNEEVMTFLNETGFDNKYNSPIQTVQDGCIYNNM